VTDYSDRLDWFHELIVWFEELDVGDHNVDIPNCPGWKVRDVISHLAVGGAAWTLAQTHPPASAWEKIAQGMARFPRERGVELFSGTVRALEAVLLSHDGSDACHYYFGNQHCYDSYARHAAAEIRLHQIDVQRALNSELTITGEQALDGLGWSVNVALPAFVATLKDQAPQGSIMIQAPQSTQELALGSGDTIASIKGTTTDLFLHLWDRGGDVHRDGDNEAIRWWTSVTGRAFQSPAST
jgi:uncharacterized protein (TIGR03083 family)